MASTTTTARLARLRRMCEDGTARTIRQSRGSSLREIARDAGTYPSTISRWERGLRSPRGAEALAYLDVLEELIAS